MNSPAVIDGVAAFAASGTHLLRLNSETILIGLGGADLKSSDRAQASVLMTTNAGLDWDRIAVPIHAGPSAGVFSITAVHRISHCRLGCGI